MRHTWDRGGEARHDVWLVCRAVLQRNGRTPLYIACDNGHIECLLALMDGGAAINQLPRIVFSLTGHVECVRALLDGGAAINQATVGCGRSMARRGGGYYCRGCVCGDPWEPCRMHVQLVWWLPSAWWRVWGKTSSPGPWYTG